MPFQSSQWIWRGYLLPVDSGQIQVFGGPSHIVNIENPHLVDHPVFWGHVPPVEVIEVAYLCEGVLVPGRRLFHHEEFLPDALLNVEGEKVLLGLDLFVSLINDRSSMNQKSRVYISVSMGASYIRSAMQKRHAVTGSCPCRPS